MLLEPTHQRDALARVAPYVQTCLDLGRAPLDNGVAVQRFGDPPEIANRIADYTGVWPRKLWVGQQTPQDAATGASQHSQIILVTPGRLHSSGGEFIRA